MCGACEEECKNAAARDRGLGVAQGADMPDDIREAAEVIRMKESILNQAYLEAKRMRSSAEDDANKVTTQANQEYNEKVNESEVLRKAEEMSQEMRGRVTVPKLVGYL